MQRSSLILAPLALAASSATAQVTLTEIVRFDVFTSASSNPDGSGTNAEYVGSTTSVAWDGSRLFIGGIEGRGLSSTPGIVEILNIAGATGVKFVNGPAQNPNPTDIQYGTPFGQNVAGAFQGYFGMDIANDVLIASFDFAGSGSFTGDDSKIFNVSGATPVRIDNPLTDDGFRAATGPANDPGFQGNGVSAGPSVIKFSNTAGRQLYDPATGAIVEFFEDDPNTVPVEPIGHPVVPQLGLGDPSTTLHRDIDYAANGDAYIRAGNLLRYVDRTGDLTADQAVNVGGLPIGLFVSAQNVEYAEVAGAEDLVILNSRPTFTAQSFLANIQVFSPGGVSKAVTFNFLDDPNNPGTPLTPGNGGAYDFDYDPVTQTLAISDFSASQVYIFKVEDASAGDLNSSGAANAADIDFLYSLLGTPIAVTGAADKTDVDSNGLYNQSDVDVLVRRVFNTEFGDADLDGFIGQADLDAVLLNWGQNDTGWARGDYNGSGLVEQGDLDAVLLNWGFQAEPAEPASSSVPEPASLALLAVGGMLALRRRAA